MDQFKKSAGGRGIPFRLLGPFILIVLLLAAGGAVFYHNQDLRIKETAFANLESIARLKTEEIAAWRFERIQDAAGHADNPFTLRFLNGWLAGPEKAGAERIKDYFRILREHHDYSDVFLVDAAGSFRLGLSPDPGPEPVVPPELLAEALGKGRLVLSPLFQRSGASSTCVDIVAPLRSRSGPDRPCLGALVFRINAGNFLFPLIQSWPTPSATAETLLVRRDGNDVLFLNELRHRSGTALRLRIPLDQADLPAALAIGGREGRYIGKDYRGIDVLSVLKAVPDSPWFMVAKIDESEALSSWRLQAFLIIGLVLALITSATAALFVFWQRRAKAYFQALHRIEQARRESEAGHLTTLMSVGDGVITTDFHGRVRIMNPVAEFLTGWSEAEARGKDLEEVFVILNEDTHRPVENPARRVLREGQIVGLANHTVLQGRDGVERPIADSGAPIRDERGRTTGVVLVFRDRTEERRAQAKLRESERKYRLISENSSDVIWILSLTEMRLTYVSPSILKLRGYTPEEVLAQPFSEVMTPESLVVFNRTVPEVLAAFDPDDPETGIRILDIDHPRKDGTVVQTEVAASLVLDENRTPVEIMGVSRDVTERRKMERELMGLSSRQQAILAAIPDIIMEVDTNKVYTWANRAGYDFFGPEVIGKEAAFYFEGEQDTYQRVGGLFNGKKDDVYIESWQRRKDGSKRLLAWWCRSLRDDSGNITGALSSARDITEQRAAEDRLRAAVEERGVLLREIHHRVKNNMQIVSSLLSLQSRGLTDETALNTLNVSQSRIRSMALIHESLYQSKDFSRIDFPGYLRRIISYLRSLYRHSGADVNATVEAEDIELDLNRAIPLGLIVNELVTNVLKHAFPGDSKGDLVVRIEREEGGRFKLTVRDTGVGLPKDFDFERNDSLGFQIITDLVKQIGGAIEVEKDEGTTVIIRF